MQNLFSFDNLDDKISDHICIEELAPNYPVINLSNRYGTATVALHGAHVTQYTPKGQKPVIFTSQQAIYEEGKAIRGGIPICWPWFNAHPTHPELPSHGVARTQFWNISTTDHTEEVTSITLVIKEETLEAKVTISLGESLEISLTTTNITEQIQTVGGALHSYFQVSDVRKISLSGLGNTTYIDTLTETEGIQTGDILLTEETDRIYLNTTSTISIYDPEWERSITVDKTGSQSTVVWNPWIDKSSSMSDLGDDEYTSFVCIEAANARSDVYAIAPGKSHTLSTKITSV